MKIMLSCLLLVLSLTVSPSCGNAVQAPVEESPAPVTSQPEEREDTKGNGEPTVNEEADVISLAIGEDEFVITLADNSSAQALGELLAQGDITIAMRDYGGFEKVGSLGQSLPTNDEQITTKLGDVILYQGDQLSIYYDANSWSLTRLGAIQNTEHLKDALGAGEVTVTLSLKK